MGLVQGAYEYVQARGKIHEHLKDLDKLEESVPNTAEAKVVKAKLTTVLIKGASRVAGFYVGLEIGGTAVDFYCKIAETNNG